MCFNPSFPRSEGWARSVSGQVLPEARGARPPNTAEHNERMKTNKQNSVLSFPSRASRGHRQADRSGAKPPTRRDGHRATPCPSGTSPTPAAARTAGSGTQRSLSRRPARGPARAPEPQSEPPPRRPEGKLRPAAHLLAGGGRAFLAQAAPVEQVAGLQGEPAGTLQQGAGAFRLHGAAQAVAEGLSATPTAPGSAERVVTQHRGEGRRGDNGRRGGSGTERSAPRLALPQDAGPQRPSAPWRRPGCGTSDKAPGAGPGWGAEPGRAAGPG